MKALFISLLILPLVTGCTVLGFEASKTETTTGANPSEMKQLEKRLDSLEERVDQLEKQGSV